MSASNSTLCRFFKGNPQSFPTKILLIIIIFVSHIYFLFVDGATFWIDQIAYISLGEAMATDGGLGLFYQDIGTWFYSHLQPGAPVVWLFLKQFPENMQWPILAFLQHGLAGWSTYCTFSTLHKYWPSKFHVLTAALLCTLPFYQAFHNSFMTESVASSMLMLGLSLWIRLMKDEVNATKQEHWKLILCIFVLGMFRGYLVVTMLALALIAVYVRREVISRYVLGYVIALFMVALMFPIYKYAAIGDFYFPSGGMNRLMAGMWLNNAPSDDIRENIEQSRVLGYKSNEDIPGVGFGYHEALKFGFFLKKSGLSNSEINKLAERTGKLLSNDGYVVYHKKMLMALASSGFVLPYCFSSISSDVFPNMKPDDMCKHLIAHYNYLSWTDNPSHKNFIQSFFLADNAFDELYAWKKGKQVSYSMLATYTYDLSIKFRDPLRSGCLPPDIWAACGVVALIILLIKERLVALGLLAILAINSLITFIIPVGDIRYAYVLFPMYFIAVSISLESRRLLKGLHL